MGVDGGHVLGEITAGPAGEAGGVGGQYRGGKDGGLVSAGGQDGERHGQGALTHAGNVLDGEDSFVCHDKPPWCAPLGTENL